MKKYLLICSIILTIIGCSKDETKPKVQACFDYSPKGDIKVGDTIIFLNCSVNSDNFTWDFGDKITSTEKSPLHVFTNSGRFLVKLTTTNSISIDTISQTLLILDKNFINLHDTVIAQTGVYGYGTISYFLDIDKDNLNDLEFDVTYTFCVVCGTTNSTTIIPMNGYEVATESYIETSWAYGDNVHNMVKIPRRYNNGDTIKISDTFSESPIDFALLYHNDFASGETKRDHWVGIGDKYIGIRKIVGNETKLCWIKVNVFAYSAIQLKYLHYSSGVNEMVILDNY